MSSFKILVCEDTPADQRNIRLHLGTIKRSLPDVEITSTITDFEATYDELDNAYDLLILDLGDSASNTNAGDGILMHNKEKHRIPTLVYTSTADSFGWELRNKQKEHPFLLEKLTKLHHSGQNLIDYVKGFIIVGNRIKKYKLYNQYDEILKLSIKFIGEDSFNYILHSIYEKFVNKEITVYPMTPGLSGAVLFKLEIEHSTYILKLSREVHKLREEHEKGKQLYNLFPSHLINYIVPEEYESFDKNVLGFLIKNVEDAMTLFEFIRDSGNDNVDQIAQLLQTIYLDRNSLCDLFKQQKGEEIYWLSIFDKIDESKLLLVKKSFREVTPILEKYYRVFDFEDLRRTAISYDYGNLRKDALRAIHVSKAVISHGDFHSNNVLIQSGNRPVIIDTGAIRYQHWSLDFSRLIVHLFINGIDNGRLEYFELSALGANISMLEKIIEGSPIAHDGRNDNFISALNWLTESCSKIFEQYQKFELQLGLMKEFLQASYRIDTIPPSKRAIALIGAHKCMLAANMSIPST